MNAPQAETSAALPQPDEITELLPSTEAACAICWRRATVAIAGRLLCRQCGADETNGCLPWLD